MLLHDCINLNFPQGLSLSLAVNARFCRYSNSINIIFLFFFSFFL